MTASTTLTQVFLPGLLLATLTGCAAPDATPAPTPSAATTAPSADPQEARAKGVCEREAPIGTRMAKRECPTR